MEVTDGSWNFNAMTLEAAKLKLKKKVGFGNERDGAFLVQVTSEPRPGCQVAL